MNYYGSICLSDIPKEVIKEGKNGKKYLNITVWERKLASEWGHTHTINTILKNVRIGEHPSMIAASIISSGRNLLNE